MNTHQNYEITKIKSALKEQLRKKDMTYEDLAQDLNCSLPTVNRILGPEEITLSRLLELCEILDLKFSDLAQLTKTQTTENNTFTAKQDAFLAKNTGHFSYLMHLISGETPEKIATKFKLTKRSTDKYLIDLENENLLKVSKSGKYKLTVERPELGGSKLGRKYFSNIIENTSVFFKTHILRGLNKEAGATPTQLSTAILQLRPDTFSRFKQEQLSLLEKYTDISDLEEKAYKKKDLKPAIFTVGFTQVENDYDLIDQVNSFYGQIENL